MSNRKPSLLPHALQYAGRGWHVFAISPSKVPFKGSHGFKDGTADPAKLEPMWQAHPFAAIGLSTGWHETGPNIVVLDADGERGLKDFQALHLPPTLAARTPSGGWHFFYLLPEAERLESWRLTHYGEHQELALKADRALVLLPPSKGRSWAFDIPMAVLSAAAIEQLRKPRSSNPPEAPQVALALGTPPAWLAAARGKETSGVTDQLGKVFITSELPDFLQALKQIPASCSYDDWFRFGAGIYDFDPGPVGLAIFIAWSKTSPKHFEEAESKCTEKWEREYPKGPSSGGKRVTVKTVYDAASEYRLLAEQQAFQEAFAKQAQNTTAAEPESEEDPPPEETSPIFGANAQPAPPSLLTELNSRYAVIGDVGGKCLVLGWVPSRVDPQIQVPSFQTFKNFTERYAHQYQSIGREIKPIGASWLKWPGRRSFEGINLVPNGPPLLPGGVLNLWTGFGVEAKAGRWDRMQAHIYAILAGSETESAEYIFRFAAWAVQHPGERAEVALVFRGGKGSGKGTFANALKAVFGQHGLQIYSSKHLVGSFNGHLRNCILLFADEAFWAGDRQGESALKGLLTEPTLMIEQKGIDATPWPNHLHVIMAANADWVVPASHDERRYAIFDVKPDMIGNRQYFTDLHEELTQGGLSAMLYDLQRANLGAWHPRHIVQTEALREQKARSLGALAGWWENLLQNGVLPFHEYLEPTKAQAGDILDHAKRTSSRPQEVNGTSLGRFLKEQKCEGLHKRNGNFWQFPALLDAKRAWEDKMGKWKWDNECPEWRDNNKRGDAKPSQPSQPLQK